MTVARTTLLPAFLALSFPCGCPWVSMGSRAVAANTARESRTAFKERIIIDPREWANVVEGIMLCGCMQQEVREIADETRHGDHSRCGAVEQRLHAIAGEEGDQCGGRSDGR